jgi:vacuolar protein sorting-associated protein 54
MLRDAEHFKSKIGGLDGAGDAGDYIVGLVKAKSVPKPKPPITERNPQEALAKDGITLNGNSTSEVSSEGPPEADEKGKQEEKQGEEAKEQAAP